MEDPRSSSASTATPNLARVPSSLGMSLLLQQGGGAPQASLDAQAIVDAATAAALAAGPTYRNPGGGLPGEDFGGIPPHRPFVGGGAAAAYEAKRHDHYVRIREQKLEQQRKRESSGADERASHGNSVAALVSESTDPREHFEMLKLHHINLVKEMQETSIMMVKFQQNRLQQQQRQDDPSMAMQLLRQKQQQLLLMQQRMQQQQQLQRHEQLMAVAQARAAPEQADGSASLQPLQMIQQMRSMRDNQEKDDAQQKLPPKPLLDEEDLSDDEDEDNHDCGDGCASLRDKQKRGGTHQEDTTSSKRARTDLRDGVPPQDYYNKDNESGEDCSSDSELDDDYKE